MTALFPQQEVPRTIHQIWIGPRVRPTKWMHTWEEFCTQHGFEYVFWDEQKIDSLLQNHPSREVYKQAKFYGMKADVARYEILAQHGGIYIDADIVYLSQHPEALFGWYGVNVVPEPLDNRMWGNALIGCPPNHPFMHYLSDTLHIVAEGREREFGSTFDDCWKITGPLYLTQMLGPVAPAVNLLETRVFFPSDWEHDQTHKTFDTLRNEFPNAATFHYGYETCRIPERHPGESFVLET